MIIRIKELYNSKNFIYYVLGLALISFTINYLFNQFLIEAYPYVAFFLSTIYSSFTFLALFLFKDTKKAMTFVFFYPFMHATFMKMDFNTLMSFLPTVIMVIGVIVHHIIFKTTIRMQKMIFGTIIYLVGIAFGGIGSISTSDFNANFSIWYVLAILLVSALIIYVMLVMTSDNEATFKDYAILITYTGIYICLEALIFFIVYISRGYREYFDDKVLHLGWGGPNNIASQLLMFLPGAMYLLIKEKNKIFYASIAYLFVYLIIIAFSRGSIFVLVLFLPWALLLTLKYSDSKIKVLLCHIVGLSIIGLMILLVFLCNRTLFDKVMDQLLNIRFDTMNNRLYIYESLFRIWEANKAFGVGLIGSFNWNVDFPVGYQFAHNTILQMLLVSGIFGLVSITLHLLDKYLRVLVKPTFEKIIVFFTFILPGIYGLFDVTYLNTVFLVSLFASYCMFNDIFKNDNQKWYSYF